MSSRNHTRTGHWRQPWSRNPAPDSLFVTKGLGTHGILCQRQGHHSGGLPAEPQNLAGTLDLLICILEPASHLLNAAVKFVVEESFVTRSGPFSWTGAHL